MTPQRDTLVKLTDCYENTSKAGNRYYVGYLGGVKLVMLPRKDAKDGEPQWSLFITFSGEALGKCLPAFQTGRDW